jgi:hypothetical protein
LAVLHLFLINLNDPSLKHRWPWLFCLGLLVFLLPMIFKIIWLSKFLTLSIPDKGYSGNMSCILPFSMKDHGQSWLWLYGSWIYNYLCNQCLLPLKLWVRTGWWRDHQMYSIQHYVIKFVNDLRQIGGFLRFPPLIKLTATI